MYFKSFGGIYLENGQIPKENIYHFSVIEGREKLFCNQICQILLAVKGKNLPVSLIISGEKIYRYVMGTPGFGTQMYLNHT